MRRRILLPLVSAILLTSASIAPAGQGQPTKAQDDVFKKGIEALDDEEWAAAVKYFQEAIRLDPNESKRKIGGRFGLGGDEYLPHVRLGQAFIGLGDCGSAFRAWEESERQGVIKKSEDGQEIIEEGSEECEDKGFLTSAAFAAQEQKVQAVLRDAAEIEKDIATLRAASSETSAGESGKLYERGRTELASARTKLDAARRTRLAQAVTDAMSAAENARTALTTARRSAEGTVESGTKFRAGSTEVEVIIDRASRSAQVVTDLVASSPVPLTLPTETREAQQRAQASLDGAKEKIALARKSGAEGELTEARQLATRAQMAFGQLQTDIERLRSSTVEREIQRLRTSLEQALAAADARVNSTQALLKSRAPASGADKATAQLTSARGSLLKARKQFDQAASVGDLASARTAARAVADINDTLDGIAPIVGGPAVTPTVPDALKAAAQAFFGGRYEEVSKLLGDEVLDSMPASFRIHAYTLRSASLFARFEYSNRKDASLRQAARADADASRRIDPAFQPNPAAFAPKFVAFYSETASAAR